MWGGGGGAVLGAGRRLVPPVTRGRAGYLVTANTCHLAHRRRLEPQVSRYPCYSGKGAGVLELFNCADLATDQKIIRCFLQIRRDF